MASSVSFLLRFSMTSMLQKAYTESVEYQISDRNLDPSSSTPQDRITTPSPFEWAQSTESKILEASENDADYQQRCEIAITNLGRSTSQPSLLDAAWDSIVASTSTKKMDRYVKLVSHSRGRFSTLYKALRIPSPEESREPKMEEPESEEEESSEWFQPQSKTIATPEQIAAATQSSDHSVYALKVTMPAVMAPPHDSKREVRILRHLAQFRKDQQDASASTPDQEDHIVHLLESFRHDGDFFVIAFPFLPLNLQDLLDNAKPQVQFRNQVRSGSPADELEVSAQGPNQVSKAFSSIYSPLLDQQVNRGPTLSQFQLRACFQNIFVALSHIHAAGVIHRDIKPSNILLKSLDGPAYITDFGISWLEPATSTVACAEPADGKIIDIGTQQFRAPELMFGYKAYGPGVDLWAMGCMVAEAMNPEGKELFFAGDLGSDLVLIHSIFTSLGTPNEERWPETSSLPDWGKLGFVDYPSKPWLELIPQGPDSLRDFVSKLVTYPTASRMSAQKALTHPFLDLTQS